MTRVERTYGCNLQSMYMDAHCTILGLITYMESRNSKVVRPT